MLKYFYPCQPNEVFPGTSSFDNFMGNPAYGAEIKKNGWRCEVYGEGDKIVLWSRHGKLIENQDKDSRLIFLKSEILRVFGNWQPFVLDGELIHFRTDDEKGKLYVFDLLVQNGESRRNLPLKERRKPIFKLKLPEIQKKSLQKIFIPKVEFKNKKEFFKEVLKDESVEGIVIKHEDSKYPLYHSAGNNFPMWIKIKK